MSQTDPPKQTLSGFTPSDQQTLKDFLALLYGAAHEPDVPATSGVVGALRSLAYSWDDHYIDALTQFIELSHDSITREPPIRSPNPYTQPD